MAAKKATGARKLLVGYLERISSNVFADFPKQLTSLVGEQHGVYALYKGNRLYYVGLAGNLRNRIKHHLKDRHAGKWNAFSLYLVRRADYLHELESVVLRIADPKGNKTAGRLSHAQNLRSQLEDRIKGEQQRQLDGILGESEHPSAGQVPAKAKPKAEPARGRKATLAPYVKARFTVRAVYKGRRFKASVRKNGTVRFDGQVFTSPSHAAKAIVGRATNGWRFWHYRNDAGQWVPLRELRKES